MRGLWARIRVHPYYTALGVVVFLFLVTGAWLVFGHHSVKGVFERAKNQLTAKEAPSPLTGLMVPVGEAHRTPVAVMIENHPDARPQSGLDKAGLVYEAYAEGGITRFMAVYVDGEESRPVGPVRSVRTYYLDWASEIHAVLSHVGGNMDALDLIPSTKVYNLDEFANAGAYWRDNSRYAPHNMYTTLERLRSTAKAHGYPPESTFPVWKFKDPLKAENRPATAEFTVNYGGSYAVRWVYDKASNRYTRYQSGAVHADKETGAPITASNVIVQTVGQTNIKTRIGEEGLRLDTVGGGPAQFFQDGQALPGTWKKVVGEKTRFYLSDGTELKLNRGPTWVSVIPPWVTAG